MTEISREILEDRQVRKTKQQKTDFIGFMKQNFPDMKVEEGGRIMKSRNLVIGDVESTDFILTAHYDTCAALPFPNVLSPTNFAFTLFYSILICVPFFAIMGVVLYLLLFLIDDFLVCYWISLAVLLILIFAVFMGGKPNKHTANDNTSGVIMLIELMNRLSDEQKKRTAFVFFDNEENGLLGSAFFAKKYKNCLADKLVINFDCVSDGENILIVQNDRAKKKLDTVIKNTFLSESGKTVYVPSFAFYPSDQMQFPVSIAVAALKRKKGIGLYLDRIHTKRDTVFDKSNIEYICEKTASLLDEIIKRNQT
ncbi:MAG: M28 family metallopeptidase [Acutalibacteraceae bacterium]